MTTTIIDAKTLREAVTRATACTSDKPTMPILGHLLLRPASSGSVIEVHATDLESYYVETVPFIGGGDLVPVCAPARALASALKTAKTGTVTIEITSNKVLVVTTTAGQTRLPAMPAEEWPALPAMPAVGVTTSEVDAVDLQAALAWVLPAASTDPSRFNLQAVSFEPLTAELAGAVVAVDGRRCHVAPAPPDMPAALLPAEGVRRLAKMLPKAGTVEVAATEVNVRFSADGRSLTVRQHDAQFPDWRFAVPKESTTVAELAEPVRLAGDLKALDKSLACLRVTVPGRNGDTLEWTARNGDGLEAKGSWPVVFERRAEGPFVFGVNRHYLAQALSCRASGTAIARISLVDPLSPIRIDHAGGFFALVMPTRV